MNRLIRQLIIKTIVVAIVIIVLSCSTFVLTPDYHLNDLYEISGTCVDIKVSPVARTGKKIYLIMDNGNSYYLPTSLRKEYIDIEYVYDLKGMHFDFCAVNTFFGEAMVVAWNDTDEIRESTLAFTNKERAVARIVMIVILSFFGLVFLTPSILRITQKRDQIKETAWRKKKREAEKQRLAEKQLESNGSSKKRPQNMSAKKWKKRHKRK